MHVDTGHNFPEVLEFRDRRVAELGVELIVASVPDAIERGLVKEEPNGSRNRIQTPVLLEAVEKGAVHRGLRRRPTRRGAGPGQGAGVLLPRRLRPVGPEEPASRAVEPVQRAHPPRRAHAGLPAVELDRARHLGLHRAGRTSSCPASTSRTSGRWSTATACCSTSTSSSRPRRARRSSSSGCATAPSATPRSPRPCDPTPTPCDKVLDEIAATRITERGATRGDDKVTEAAMEDRKREGYF